MVFVFFPPDVCVERTIYDTIVTLPMIAGGYYHLLIKGVAGLKRLLIW